MHGQDIATKGLSHRLHLPMGISPGHQNRVCAKDCVADASSHLSVPEKRIAKAAFPNGYFHAHYACFRK
jgi:hypothetical protein